MVLKLPLGQNVAPMNTHEQPALKMMAWQSGSTGRSRGRLLSGNRGGCQEETKESAGTVRRDLGFVYVSSDPLICAQFTRSTSSILRINEGMGHQKKSIIVGWVVGWGF